MKAPLTQLKDLTLQQMYAITNLQRLPPMLVNLDLALGIVDDLRPLASQIHLQTIELGRYQPLPEEFQSVELDLAPLATLHLLETLTLEYYKVKRLEALNGLTRLTFLDLEHTNVRDVSALRDTHAPLEVLYLSGTLVEDVTPLFSLQSLQQLSLPPCASCTQLKT